MFRFARLAATAAIIATGLPLSHVVAQEKSLTVFAAASLRNALDDANAAFTRQQHKRQ